MAEQRTKRDSGQAAELERLQEQVDLHKAMVIELQQQLAEATNPTRLCVPADALPVDYRGHLPRVVVVSLRPDLRRTVMALHRYLLARHATIRHPRYHDQVKHIDAVAHVLVWLVERIALVGDASDQQLAVSDQPE